ncbi:hypothetical protein ACS0TY_030148 [Phlomoides rotata]
MKIIAAYLLVVLGGNASPSADDLKSILGSSKDITELIASGREKLALVPSGGGGVAVAAPAEAKKEEKVEEKEESDDDMGFGLFD